MTAAAAPRRLPVGAEVSLRGAQFRVWAPKHRALTVLLPAAGQGPETARSVPLTREDDGYWSALVPGVVAGDRYWFSIDGGPPVPDPASRYQPEGPHGPSMVVDPGTFAWSDGDWRGAEPERTGIYELHMGTYTREGTFAAAQAHLPELLDLGIGMVELMPLGDFPGRFGWGYDGVDLFAPCHLYGTPDDLRAFVDGAHALHIGVIVDVVYNHFGPDGCYVGKFADSWFSKRHHSDWGETPNFDDDGAQGVRDFVIANAVHWIAEYHLDGLRIDATQQIFDASADHIVAAITRAARTAGGGRRIFVVAENEPQETRLVRSPDDDGFGLDAIWNDDVHHSAMVALTGRREFYYTDYWGTPQELLSAARHGYLFQGQTYAWQGERRGTPALDLEPSRFVSYIQNHDQVANSLRGERLSDLASPGRLRAMTAYLLLGPPIPMLFMGQEWAASSPFLYFADHETELAKLVHAGRQGFLSQFPSLAPPDVLALVPNPSDLETFERSRLDHDERTQGGHARWLALHRDLLTLRRTTPAFGEPRHGCVDGAILTDDAFLLRFFAPDGRRGASAGERLLIVNLGPELALRQVPEPLLAPPLGHRWELELSTEDPAYGGAGTPEPESRDGWLLPPEAAVVLRPVPRSAAH